jgi:hypothetical protein
MGLYTDSTGKKTIEIPDDVAPARRQEIIKQRGLKPLDAKGTGYVSPHQKEVDRRFKKLQELEKKSPLRSKLTETSNDLAQGTAGGVFSSFNDEASGLVSGAMGALRGRNPVEEYRIGRDVERRLTQQARERSPVASTVGEIAGAVAQPTEAITAPLGKVAGLVGKVSPRAARAAKAAKLAVADSRVGTALARSPLARAVGTGAGQGALNAAGENENLANLPGDVVRGSIAGGAGAAVFAGATRAGQAGLDFLRAGTPERVEETAYGTIGRMLDRRGPRGARAARRAAENAGMRAGQDVVPGEMAAQQAEKTLGRAAAQGNDEILADLSPSLRGTYGGIARNTELDVANDIGKLSESRLDARGPNFMGKLEDNVGTADATSRQVEIAQAKKAAGARDYNDTVMKKPFVWSDDIEDITVGANASDDMRQGLKEAARIIRNTHDDNGKLMDPTALGWRFNEAGDVMYMKVPNMESFDLVKRGFDTRISEALAAGRNDEARRVSKTLNMLKERIGNNNPDYLKALANQRDLFQKQEAVEKGQELMQRLQGNRPGRGARELLHELRALPANQQMDYRLGVVDAMTRLDSKQNPLATWQNMTRSPEQKKVMEWVFGDKAELEKFNRWVRRERNSAATDIAGNTKAGSISSNALLAAEGADVKTNPLFNAFKGYAFGGPIGGISGAAMAFSNKLRGRTGDVQELMGQMLMSKGSVGGEKISEGIRRTGKRVAAREAKQAKTLKGVAKGSQQLFSGFGSTKAYGTEEEY